MRPPAPRMTKPGSTYAPRSEAPAPAPVRPVASVTNKPEASEMDRAPRVAKASEVAVPRAPKVHPARPPEGQASAAARRVAPKPAPEPKVSRRTPPDHVRLHVNVGEEMQVGPGDIVGAIMGETGLPPKTVGTIDMRERHSFVDVSAEHANAIIAKLNRARLKGNKLKVKMA